MKLSEVTLGLSKVFVTEYKPGTGFESKLKNECAEHSVNFINLHAYKFVDSAVVDGKFTHIREFPEVTRKTLWVIDGFEELSENKQVEFFSKLNTKVNNPNLGIVISTTNMQNLNPEILEKSMLYLDVENLPPVHDNINLGGLPTMENIAEIRRKSLDNPFSSPKPQ